MVREGRKDAPATPSPGVLMPFEDAEEERLWVEIAEEMERRKRR